LNLAENAQKEVYYEIDDFEEQTGFAIDSNWLNELALHTQIVVKMSPLSYAHGRVLFSALSKYLAKDLPDSSAHLTIWETGTARGFSAICMAKALDVQNRSGTIVTFDVLPHHTPMYWNCIDDLEGEKTRAELLSPWKSLLQNHILFHQGDTRLELPKVQTERIHFAFLDGAHTYKNVMFEFEQIQERQEVGDMIVYDDYTPQQFPGIVQAVDEICQNYHYHRTDLKSHKGRGYIVATKA
jgi:predicted O-methyltransferase YrrM